MLYLAYQVGAVAQLVEQRTENPRVAGSIPAGGTKVTPDGLKGIDSAVTYADVAHLVERHLAKVEVAGSSPVIRSKALYFSAFFRTEYSAP